MLNTIKTIFISFCVCLLTCQLNPKMTGWFKPAMNGVKTAFDRGVDFFVGMVDDKIVQQNGAQNNAQAEKEE